MGRRLERVIDRASLHVGMLSEPGESAIQAFAVGTSGWLRKQGGEGIQIAVVSVTDRAVYRSTGYKKMVTVRHPIDKLSASAEPYDGADRRFRGTVITLLIDEGSIELTSVVDSQPTKRIVQSARRQPIGVPTIHEDQDPKTSSLVHAMIREFRSRGRDIYLGAPPI